MPKYCCHNDVQYIHSQKLGLQASTVLFQLVCVAVLARCRFSCFEGANVWGLVGEKGSREGDGNSASDDTSSHAITTLSWESSQNNYFKMVKLRDFSGAVFLPEEYQHVLARNIENLESVPMSKSFKSAEGISSGLLRRELLPACYIYRQCNGVHVSVGVLAEISLQDYHSHKIKPHEKTLKRQGLDRESYRIDHVGPVVVSHRTSHSLEAMVSEFIINNAPYAVWTTVDAREHSLWRVLSSDIDLSREFQGIESLYVLDGHHRLEAAHQNYVAATTEGEACPESDKWIQAIIYSASNVVVHSQHRVFKGLESDISLVEQLLSLDSLQVTNIAKNGGSDWTSELEIYEVVFDFKGNVFGINFKREGRSALDKVPAFRLQNQIFTELLSPKENSTLEFVPGIQWEKIRSFEVVFYVRAPSIETVFQIADESFTFPPKSTWIEPKPCSHMVIRLPDL